MANISENEVEKAIQRCQLYVGKHYNEGGGDDLKDAINTLIRAAQFAPVDLERVRELVSRGKMLQETAWMDVEPMPCEVEAQSCFEQALALLPPKESK